MNFIARYDCFGNYFFHICLHCSQCVTSSSKTHANFRTLRMRRHCIAEPENHFAICINQVRRNTMLLAEKFCCIISSPRFPRDAEVRVELPELWYDGCRTKTFLNRQSSQVKQRLHDWAGSQNPLCTGRKQRSHSHHMTASPHLTSPDGP